MKILFLIVSLFFLSACIIVHRDKLSFYNESYVPNPVCIKTNGFYVNTNYNWFGNKYLAPVFFYDDGSFYYGSTFKNISDIEEDSKNFKTYHGDLWGFYLYKKDSIIIEGIIKDITTSYLSKINVIFFQI